MKKNFNILAAINKQLKQDKIPVFKQTTYERDPNKISWPYLRVAQLKPDTDYTLRFLPPHDTHYPEGYVYKEMYQVAYDLDLNPKGRIPKT